MPTSEVEQRSRWVSARGNDVEGFHLVGSEMTIAKLELQSIMNRLAPPSLCTDSPILISTCKKHLHCPQADLIDDEAALQGANPANLPGFEL